MNQEVEDMAENAMDTAQSAVNGVSGRARALCRAAQDKAAYGAKATDRAIRSNPYTSIGIAFGLGILAGYLQKKAMDA